MLILFVLLAPLATSDAALGTWKFNAGDSTYQSGPAPRESQRRFVQEGALVRFIHTGISAAGKPFRTEFAAGYDGKDYPVTGGALYDSVSLTMKSAHVVAQTFRKQGAVTVEAVRTVSSNGKRLTIVATGANAEGKQFRNVLVYDRVD